MSFTDGGADVVAEFRRRRDEAGAMGLSVSRALEKLKLTWLPLSRTRRTVSSMCSALSSERA
ncbi:hypothetical protein STRIP9103_00217 [Streptomyces ipomoeae 91-03]|uniref:Uncharacterized protein n=1 Tax=Streptomyces ipomoeae 91-03 TaxID=698759 RepID=L1KQ41_9ACTN|nr:hypothetical protein STRIP9103_00217 [Streptomyces ipomoeae 91-03]